MKRLIASISILILTTGVARASFTLETSNEPGSPLTMAAGSVSGPMEVTIVSNNPSADVMAAWNILLEIVPNNGTVGTVTSRPRPPERRPTPPITSSHEWTGHLGHELGKPAERNDFFNPSVGTGTTTPATGANLLQLNFSASATASGLFGVYAVEGAAYTQWTDSQFNTQFFSNVPSGTSTVEIGQILVPAAVPEPSPLVLSVIGALAVLGHALLHRRSC